MILFLEYSGSGQRGGETYHDHLHRYLVSRFEQVSPNPRESMPDELRNPLRHMLYSRARVGRNRPGLVVADIASAGRNCFALGLARRFGGTVLLVIQGERRLDPDGSTLRRRWIRSAERSVIRNADIILANSRFSESLVRDHLAVDVPMIIAPPGLETRPDDEVPRPASAGPVRLLYVGECSRVKGLADLVEAMALLPEATARLDVVGGHSQEPAYYRQVVDRAAELGLQDRVKFRGFLERDALEPLYRQSDILVVPSLAEGYGMVVAEAYCHGLPVVATDAGALAEIVTDGENGLLVPPADPAAFAEALRRLADDPGWRQNMAKANLRRASSLPTWEDFTRTLDTDLAPRLRALL